MIQSLEFRNAINILMQLSYTANIPALNAQAINRSLICLVISTHNFISGSTKFFTLADFVKPN